MYSAHSSSVGRRYCHCPLMRRPISRPPARLPSIRVWSSTRWTMRHSRSCAVHERQYSAILPRHIIRASVLPLPAAPPGAFGFLFSPPHLPKNRDRTGRNRRYDHENRAVENTSEMNHSDPRLLVIALPAYCRECRILPANFGPVRRDCGEALPRRDRGAARTGYRLSFSSSGKGLNSA